MTVSEIKNDYKLYLKKIKREIPEILAAGKMSRKELAEKVRLVLVPMVNPGPYIIIIATPWAAIENP